MRVGSDGAAEFADPDPLAGLGETLVARAEFIVHQRQFQTEGDRLGVDTVAAPDHRGLF